MNDEYQIDKKRVRLSFGRAATGYEKSAVLQREVLNRMLSRLEVVALKPQAILDAGCGTGLGGRSLAKRYKKSCITSLDFAPPMLQMVRSQQHWLSKLLTTQTLICGDIEAMPIQATSQDLVWSNLALQWCNDLDAAFTEMHRVLRPEGLLMFSTFGPDTLKELRQSASIDGRTHVSRFIDMHDIGDALIRAGFSAPVMDVEYFTLTYDNALGVMRELKAIGAHNATQGRPQALHGRKFLQDLSAQYEHFRQADGKLPATYEVVYGHAWKPQPKAVLADGAQPLHFRKR
ncbi:MAG: malonyl-ACP O-methyltransferase BioC [Methylophilaceae bacterium]